MIAQASQLTITVPPVAEPVTIAEAKRQLFLAASDTQHDDDILRTIQVAREQWESDTDSASMTQTIKVYLSRFGGPCVYLPRRPIQSVTSVIYYDSDNTQQTLSTSIYSLNPTSRAIELKSGQSWPTVIDDRWDAIAITYVCGYTSRQLVPGLHKQAMLLLCGYYFDANRGDNDRLYDGRAYESLVAKCLRSNYP